MFAGGMGPVEWAIIGGIALVIFGPKKLPQIGQAIGGSLREFKKAASGIKDELEEAANTANEEEKKNIAQAESSIDENYEQYDEYEGEQYENTYGVSPEDESGYDGEIVDSDDSEDETDNDHPEKKTD